MTKIKAAQGIVLVFFSWKLRYGIIVYEEMKTVKILVLGATGRVGSHIVSLAVQDGHRVTA